jgi:hypothetical protein
MYQKSFKLKNKTFLLFFPVIILIIWFTIRKTKTAKIASLIETIPEVTNSGLTPSRLQTLSAIANDIYNALYKYFLGAFEDEAAVIQALNRVLTPTEAKVLSVIYLQSFGKSLRSDVDKYLLAWESSEIKPIIYKNLN